MELFVEPNSVVRKIWGKSDTILFIFAGAAADLPWIKLWTGFIIRATPADPWPLFSTVAYAKKMFFHPWRKPTKQLILSLHSCGCIQNRGASIPDWAYRDVLFMLIHYSIAAYERWRKIKAEEKEEVYNVSIV